MPDRHREEPANPLRRLYRRHHQSNAVFGAAMALIAMLFIAGIVTAFIHAADTSRMQQVQNHLRPAGPAETTGSGGAGR